MRSPLQMPKSSPARVLHLATMAGLLLLVACLPDVSPSVGQEESPPHRDEFREATIPASTYTPVAEPQTQTPTSTLDPASSTPSPSPTSTLPPAESFHSGSLARALAGSPTCRLPCWLGLVPGESSREDVDQWLIAQGMNSHTETSEDGTVTRLTVPSANPGEALAGKAKQLVIHVFHDRLDSMLVIGAPIARPVTDEIRDLAVLFGVPDHILLVPGPDYTLRLVYPARGLLVHFGAVATQAEVQGRLQDLLCLGMQQDRDVEIWVYDADTNPITPDSLVSDWAHNLGVQDADLLARLLEPGSCVPIP